MTTIKELVKIHVLAEGPVSSDSIYYYVQEQYNGKFQRIDVSAAIHSLIVDGTISRYEHERNVYTAGPRIGND